jgi:hypothetical protein
MSVVDENGNVQVLHQETSATDVLLDNTTNSNGATGTSAIPASADTMQKMVDSLGDLAFKSKVKITDLNAGVVVNNLETTAEGAVLDARAGKTLSDRIAVMEDEELLAVGSEEEDTDIQVPESEINDEITSETMTWSSTKITEYITEAFAGIANAEDNSF